MLARGLGFGFVCLAVACSGSQEPSAPTPVAQEMVPATSAIGAGPLILTVTGTGFVESSVVHWNGEPRATTYESATALTAEIPAADLAEPGLFAVTVVTPSPGGGTSDPLEFAIPALAPTLTSISKTSATAGDPQFPLTVQGSGFAPSSVVLWGGVALVTAYLSPASLIATVGPEELGADATVPITVHTPAPGGGTSAALTFSVAPLIREIPLVAKDLVYHPGTGLIYASVGGDGDPPNSVVTIDPVSGEMASVPIGSEPRQLALSDDSTVLYVGLRGTGQVRRFNPVSRTPGAIISLGAGTFGTRYAEDIAVAPGNPLLIAVSMQFEGVSPRHAGLAVFENGVMLGTPTPEHSGPNVIAFSASAATLYGHYLEVGPGAMYTVEIGQNGPQITKGSNDPLAGSWELAFAGGRLYGSNGIVVDPVTHTPLDGFEVTNAEPYGARLVLDEENGRAVFLEAGDPTWTANLHAFDLETRQSIRSLPIPTAPGPSDGGGSLIRWGADGLAFRGPSSVFVIRTSLVRR